MPKIKTQSIVPRIDGIGKSLVKLRLLGQLPLEDFSHEDNFIKAKYYLRETLEGVFHIGSHILSRMPGGRSTEYKDIALKLGEFNIVEKNFAGNNLKKMAGYRNRLTHFYADVTPEEIRNIIKNNLVDIEKFIQSVKNLLNNPQKFHLELE